MIALTVVGVIAGMAIPRLDYQRYRVEAAMRSMRAALAGSQRGAIMRQTNMVVGFNESAGRLEIVEDANNDCVHNPGERLTIKPLEEGVRFAVPPVAMGTPVSTPISGANLCTIRGLPAVQFLRDGAASSDVDIYLTSARGLARDFRVIRVTMASGRAESWRLDGSTWRRSN